MQYTYICVKLACVWFWTLKKYLNAGLLSRGFGEKPLAYFFGEKVSAFKHCFVSFLNLYFKDDHFGMFIVLTLHRQSLRQMIKQGRVDHSIKIKVLEMLRSHLCSSGFPRHGDIKDFMVCSYLKLVVIWKTKQTAGKYFGRLRLQWGFGFKFQMRFGRLGNSG